LKILTFKKNIYLYPVLEGDDYEFYCLLLKGDVDLMANNSSLKNMVTKLKNKIINWLHAATLKQVVEVAKFINIRVSPELEKKSKDRE